MSKDQARCARIEVGAAENPREGNDARRINVLSHLAQDLRYAIRIFGHAPGFQGLIVFMLALGIGANLAVFVII